MHKLSLKNTNPNHRKSYKTKIIQIREKLSHRIFLTVYFTGIKTGILIMFPFAGRHKEKHQLNWRPVHQW